MAYSGEYQAAGGSDYCPGSDDDDQAAVSTAELGVYVLRHGDAGPDELAGIVVAARTPFEARRMAADATRAEEAYPWAFTATCVLIGTAADDVKPGSLLADFNSVG
jgi:hypothetical protein